MVKWAFSDRNASGRLAAFLNHWDHLAKINWPAITATDFRDMMTKERKQAEFLLHQSFPWKLVEKIGVMEQKVAEQIADIMSKATHKPSVEIERGWYF